MALSALQTELFREIVWHYYRDGRRAMPWRDQPMPYYVLVSEVMLQQTQVGRVLPKFMDFIGRFPTVQSLAAAPLGDVLQQWSGLGYNRRAKFLWQAARQICQDFGGQVPDSLAALVSLPGIGKNTAGAIIAYAYNRPGIFIETNIRTVYLHHFFGGRSDVADTEITALLGQTLDRENPREWYWALMDYGTHLKQHAGNNIGQSKHYRRQSTFAGSRREVRGKVLKRLVAGPASLEALQQAVGDSRLPGVLAELEREALIASDSDRYSLT